MKLLLPIFFGLLSFLFYQCKKDCKGISPTFSEEDKKWMSELALNDSLLFQNNKGKSNVFYVVVRSTEKKYDTGGGKNLRSKCSDYDIDLGTIKYSTLKESLTSDSIFLTLIIQKGYGEKLYKGLILRNPNDVNFTFYDPTPSLSADFLPTVSMSKEIGQYEVNGKKYPDVQYFERDTTGLTLKDYPNAIHKVYYSKQAGLIRYEYINKEVWMRKGY